MHLSNFKNCEAMWRQYMVDHHQVVIPHPDSDARPRKLLFQIMHDVRKNYVNEPDVDLRTLNNVCMNIARDVFLRKGVHTKPAVAAHAIEQNTLDRDKLYGGRMVMAGAPRPESTTREQRVGPPVSDSRLTQGTPLPLPAIEQTGVADMPIETDETTRRMAVRDEDELLASILRSSPTPLAAKQDDKAVMASNDRQESRLIENFATSPPSAAPIASGGMGINALLQNAPFPKVTERYVIINGFDRYWQVSPLRYQFTISIGGIGTDPMNKNLQMKYKNVQSIQVTRLVIPMEIVPRSAFKGIDHSFVDRGNTSMNTGTSSALTPSSLQALKGVYRHAASLSFQYVMLCIDGYNDVYDGTNDASRQSFCQLVYSTSYKAPNGRGFVIMEPMQDERKVFSPSPLASLSRLSISILRPSGALFNNSTDDQVVSLIQYEPFNRQHLRIVVGSYFDMNEFFTGDSIIVQNFLSVQPLKTAKWAPDMTASYTALNAYVNQPQGHEIVEIGLANDSGFFKSFCIMAPGAFDASIGRFVLNAAAIAAVVEMNTTTFPCPDVPFGGALLNMSLQNVVTFKIGVLEGDGPSGFAV